MFIFSKNVRKTKHIYDNIQKCQQTQAIKQRSTSSRIVCNWLFVHVDLTAQRLYYICFVVVIGFVVERNKQTIFSIQHWLSYIEISFQNENSKRSRYHFKWWFIWNWHTDIVAVTSFFCSWFPWIMIPPHQSIFMPWMSTMFNWMS